ncbi:universal stress protein [Planococcus lenghuensis]|uniref:Universal stress protein n=1 Tax=Planococcus lenghuensis TaxID=2213202 RepID=A0A1Q2KYP0_9BACL|nr:universal stress protein [Planococcus lenghuensis]AQQ53328.1 universal stress protein UspA [Planococcus lenghuensis]
MPLSYDRILVAIDGSKEAEWAFKKAIGLADRNDAELCLVNIIDTRALTMVGNANPDYAEGLRKSNQKMLDDYKQQAEAAGIQRVDTVVAVGFPKTAISRNVAKKFDADLIVCGATGMGPIEHFLLGSVSEHIVRTSRCDVLVVRTEEHAEANS